MKKLTICCDFDDTMNQLLPAWIEWLNNKYTLNVQLEEVNTWYIDKIFPTLTEDQIYEPLNTPDFWLTVEAKPEAEYYIKKIIEDGHDFYVSTASYYRNLWYKFDNCLFRLFPFIDHKQVITMYNKQLLDCDVIIDDGLHNIKGKYLGILFDMPHNRSFDDTLSNKIERVITWEQAYNLITKIAEQL